MAGGVYHLHHHHLLLRQPPHLRRGRPSLSSSSRPLLLLLLSSSRSSNSDVTSPTSKTPSLKLSQENPNPNPNPIDRPPYLDSSKIKKKKKKQQQREETSQSSSFPSLSSLLRWIRSDWKKGDGILLEIASIALPAVLALAADPLTSLVDTAFIGHIGSVELAAVGVSISVFNLISKLFNVPLLNVTTSFVAEDQALSEEGKNELSLQEPGDNGGVQSKRFLPSVSTSLTMAAGLGLAEAVALSFGSGTLMDIMGIAVDSPMRIPAENFLTVRALGAPAIVLALAAQGTFRGFKDTRTPLYAVGIGNLLNAILDPILMFFFALGVEGAAFATVVADYLIASILLWKLNKEVMLIPSKLDVKKLLHYLNSGGLLIVRTIAVLGTMTLSTSLAARQGPIPMAGHQICLQVWLTMSLLNDALALAGQALLAGEFTKRNYEQARTVIYQVLQMGLLTGLSLAVILFLGFESFCGLFTSDSAALEIARSGLLFVVLSQPVNALAFVIDGLYYGVSDFAYAAYSMVLVGILSSLLLLVMAPVFGLAGVWIGLFLFMVLRVVAGFWRLGSKKGPWLLIWHETDIYMSGK